MRLRDLEPQFMRFDEHNGRVVWPHVETPGEAQGVFFLCPQCYKDNGGSTGTHGIVCWNGTVPADAKPTGGRWNMQGTSYDDLTLVGAGGSSSVHTPAACNAHFWITSGEIQFAADSGHH